MNWFNVFASPTTLASKGILGMNQRNIAYIGQYNSRKSYPLVDNKLKTKALAIKHGITVPALIGVIQEQHEIRHIDTLLEQYSGFCIKPAQGSGGKGILIIKGKKDGFYIKSNDTMVDIDFLKRHVSNILAGLFSLGGKTDVAMIESLVHFDPRFSNFAYEGVPDTRVIVFKGYPVMAMMRLPTALSDGKANLHQGAIGVGIHLKTGAALQAVQFDSVVSIHPDTQKDLSELCLPNWDTLLRLAASCYEMSGLGYLGADMILDQHHGPMLLELNARPGLSIQVANGHGLLPRLTLIESECEEVLRNPQERVEYIWKVFE